MAKEIKLPTQVVDKNIYFILFNPAGKVWNGSSFETYVTANRGDYDIAGTEEGTQSGIYTAAFPSTITASGTYEVFGYMQTGGSVAEPPTDILIGTVEVDWTGSAVVGAGTGSMTGSDFRAYVLRGGFKRTEKDTEVYEAITDAIQEMRRRFGFSEAQKETTTTDTITVLGDFTLDIESDFGLMVGLVMEDGTDGHQLTGLPKWKFDQIYPDINATSDRGYPEHFTIYGDTIRIGPIPDSVSYVYRISYSQRAGTVISSTSAVPFTNLYREILRDGTLAKLWELMDQYQRAQYFAGKFEKGLAQAITREDINSSSHVFTVRAQEL